MSTLSLPSLHQALADLRAHLSADARRLSTLWGIQRAFSLVGRIAPPSPGFVMPTFERQPWEIFPDMLDLSGVPAAKIVEAMHAYAAEGRHPVGVQTQVFSDEVEPIEDLAFSLRSDLFQLMLQDTPREEGEWGALESLCAHTRARLDLDLGKDIALHQIAMLADMDERSVKNATSAISEEQRLKVVDQGLVDNAEARRWLKGRRAFVPTIIPGIPNQPGDHPDRLSTLMDLGNFIHVRWMCLGKTTEAVLRELEWPEERLNYLNAICPDPQLIDPRDCDDLAKTLQVGAAWFTEQVMRLLYPRQMSLLLSARTQLASTGANPATTLPNDPTAAMKLNVSTRLVFVMNDGSQWFPARMKNRDTGRIAYRLSAGGAGGNTKEAGYEVDSEDEMIKLVVEQGHAVRMATKASPAKSLIKLGGRWEGTAFLDGNPIDRS